MKKAIHKYLSFLTYANILNLGLCVGLAIIAVAIGKFGLLAGIAFAAIPILILFIGGVFVNPYIGIVALFTYNYFVMGITRYIPLPLATLVDLLFGLTYLSLVIQSFYKRVEWSNLKVDLVILSLIWFTYGAVEYFNPHNPAPQSWFYAMRGFILYFPLTVMLTYLLFNKHRDLRLLFILWSIFSTIAALKGIGQYHIGLDRWENIWLNTIGAQTHRLITGLRVFSIFTDAGHFGSAMGHSMVVFFILSFKEKNYWIKSYFILVAALSLYGMLISGTRGAIAVPMGALLMYIILSKNVKAFLAGVALVVSIFVFFRFTTIGENVYVIRRMRTAFDPREASLNTRKRNQEKLKVIMADKPFGTGIGTAGDWGQRFSPQTEVAPIPTDSWFVSIWVEQGIVGLSLHLFILFYVLIKGSYYAMFRIKNRDLIVEMRALLCGIFGIMLTSYGNGILGQFPTGMIFYMSQVFVLLSPAMEQELAATDSAPDIIKLNPLEPDQDEKMV